MIIDLDAHQGNGHEKDFAHDGMSYILFLYAFCFHYDDTVMPIFTCRKGLHFGHVQCWNLSVCKNHNLEFLSHLRNVNFLLLVVML